MNLRNLKIVGAVSCGLALILYVLGAFICGSWNPVYWNVVFKFFLAVVWVAHVWLIPMIPVIKKLF